MPRSLSIINVSVAREHSMREEVISRRAAAAMICVVLVSLGLGAYFSIFGSPSRPEGLAANDSFSVSAIGHNAFLKTLQQLEYPVSVSRFSTLRKLGPETALVLAETTHPSSVENRVELQQMLAEPGAVLVILPKWSGANDFERPEWIQSARHVGERHALEAFGLLGISARLIRSKSAASELVWNHNNFGFTPFVDKIQLFESKDIVPLVACSEGILAGEYVRRDGGKILFLSDPDIIANHALGLGENAALACAIADRLRDPGRAIVWDETMHGHTASPSVFRDLFQFPAVFIIIQFGIVILFLLWASVARFGEPRAAEPEYEPGLRTLIENTAGLFVYNRYSLYALDRYWNQTLHEVAGAVRVRAPRESLVERLAAAANVRKVNIQILTLEQDINNLIPDGARIRYRVGSDSARQTRAALAIARQIYQWKMEMLHGSAINIRPGRIVTFTDTASGDRAEERG
ncbi:MAG: DUF4350 domain-containing protein [Planctomycetota bacterium]